MAAVEDGLVWSRYGSTAPALRQEPAAVPEEPGRRSREEAAGLRRGLGVIVLVAGLLGTCAAGSARVVALDFRVQATTTRLQQLQALNRQLTVEAAQLANPRVINQEAVDRYGMRPVSGYTPITVQPVPKAAPLAPAHTAEAVLPLPAGPAPGGAVALAGRLGAWLHRVGGL
jgi:cell division protein FtsB